MNIHFWIMPVVSGIIGFITNILAIAMILRPFKAKYIFGVPIPFTPGLIHKRKAELAKTLATTINDTLLTEDTVKKALSSNKIAQSIKDFIDLKIKNLTIAHSDIEAYLTAVFSPDISHALISYTKNEEMLRKNLQTLIDLSNKLVQHTALDEKLKPLIKNILKNSFGPMSALIPHEKVYSQLKSSVIELLADEEKLKNQLLAYLDTENANFILVAIQNFLTNMDSAEMDKLSERASQILSHAIENQLDKAITKLDFKASIEEKLLALSEQEIYLLIMDIAKKELTYISVFGGVLGFLIGSLVQLLV